MPVAEIAAAFNRLYRNALNYNPIYSSTPFFNALSWADVFELLPTRFQCSANPADLFKRLLSDHSILTDFLFTSFLPRRFYGNIGRYPLQHHFIKQWLAERDNKTISCLDAACGTGEETYSLIRRLFDSGYSAKDVQVEGWTIEPLEVWCARECRFPGNINRETDFRERSSWLFENGYQKSINFYCSDLIYPTSKKKFDLIVCNGLLGGPIINRPQQVEIVVKHLADMLRHGGLLLAADHFHGGWKQHCPQQSLQAVFESNGLSKVESGEGVGGLKLH